MCATYLDFRVYRHSTRRGQYNQMQDPNTGKVLDMSKEPLVSKTEYTGAQSVNDLAEREDERAHLTHRSH
jgi:hypothetical protein